MYGKKRPLSLSGLTNTFSDSSYGSSVVARAATSVTENLLNDKELQGIESDDKLNSEKVSHEKDDQRTSTPSPIDSKFSLSNAIVHANDKHCGDFESGERDSEEIYAPVESYPNQNNYYGDYQAGDLSNWPYDLSRTSAIAKSRIPSIDYAVQYANSAQASDSNLNFRSAYNPYVGAMKGNIMTMCQFNDYLSPPSSVSSSSGYDISDNNNNSFINIDQALHLSTIDDVIRDDLKHDNCFLVEDLTAGNYTTLTTASSAPPLDLYQLHDFRHNYMQTHSTSSGGDSRSPGDYTNEEYDHGNIIFTPLTPLNRSNETYASSPNPAVDHNIMPYDSTHVMSPAR